MTRNEEYKQITNFDNHDCLNGKVVDKVAFLNSGADDTQMFIILFTDKSYVCIGLDDDFALENNYLPWFYPQNVNSGDFKCHSWVDENGKIHFEEWINVLREFGIWEFTDEDAKAIIDANKAKEEEWEYQQYLRLKEKFEGK